MARQELTGGNGSSGQTGLEVRTMINENFIEVYQEIENKVDAEDAALTGVPVAPTASPGTNTTQIATTAFVKAADDARVALQAEVNAESEDAKFITPKKLSEKPIKQSAFSATPVFTKNAEDMYHDQAANITIDATLTSALHGANKCIFINGDNSHTLSFTNKFEKLIGSSDFDNTKLNHIFCEYNQYANKIYYRIAHTNRIEVDFTAPTIVSAALSGNNAYVDINFSEGVYTNSNGTGGLISADFLLTFVQNGGVATNVTILSVKKNDAGTSVAASALTGGESIVRVFLTVTGSASGLEFFSITPASGTSIYDFTGNAMSSSQTTGNITMNAVDTTAPTISSAQMASNNAYIDVVMSEGIYTNTSLSPVVTADFTFTFNQNGGSATNATVSSITNTSGGALTGGESTIRFNIAITGTPNGLERAVITPASGTAINDASGNLMDAGQTTGNVNFNNSSYSATATAVFALMPDPIDTPTKNAMATFIDSQVASGNWALLTEFQCYGFSTTANKQKGWKGYCNASSTVLPTDNGTNFQFNGTSQYLLTGYIPNSDASAGLNNTTAGVLVKEWSVADGTQKMIMGCNSGSTTNLVMGSGATAGNLVRGVNNSVTNAAADYYNGEGTFAADTLYAVSRIISTTTTLLKAGSQVDSDAKTSGSRATVQMAVGARNANGLIDLYAACKLFCWFAGQAVGFNHADFEANLQTFKTALGA